MRVHTRNGRVVGRSYSSGEWWLVEVLQLAWAMIAAAALLAFIALLTAVTALWLLAAALVWSASWPSELRRQGSGPPLRAKARRVWRSNPVRAWSSSRGAKTR